MIKVIIADDNILLRDSLKIAIEKDEEIEVVACANNGKEAFELCRKHLPNIVLMDVEMPFCDGITAAKLIKEKFSSIKIIILTYYEMEEYVRNAFISNVDGYAYKNNIEIKDLILLIKSIYRNMVVIDGTAFTILKRGEFGEKQNGDKLPNVFLSRKEKEVIKLIVKGMGNKEISEELMLSEGRVRSIISEILSKLSLENRTQLALYAVKHRLANINDFNLGLQ